VDMDQEQVELVKTTYAYQYMVNSVNNDLRRLMAAAKSF
jgi:possible flagellar basal body rod protein